MFKTHIYRARLQLDPIPIEQKSTKSEHSPSADQVACPKHLFAKTSIR